MFRSSIGPQLKCSLPNPPDGSRGKFQIQPTATDDLALSPESPRRQSGEVSDPAYCSRLSRSLPESPRRRSGEVSDPAYCNRLSHSLPNPPDGSRGKFQIQPTATDYLALSP